MCSKADGFTASNVYSRTEEEETCHEDQECRRRAKRALADASSRTKCSMYREDYKCYDAIPKTCNFSGKVATQKNNCVSKCKSLNVTVSENCELKDVAQSASPVSNLPASMTTISPVVNDSHTAGRETTTAIQSGTADDDDNAGRILGNMTDTGNDVRTLSPLSDESKSGAGLMRAPVGVMEILLVWTLGRLL
ncbi:uncharacterized protein LOC124265387 [Haliotis rubra]|uniref:uncharacterized protein LOC124265387 n=1 Tax=Haliotis rubra TaxID=36100 RepID=UPI001EE51A37|nr:uncharacterized protein LOC124265387 [Haliotis rubra]